jgi:hypothetical protein
MQDGLRWRYVIHHVFQRRTAALAELERLLPGPAPDGVAWEIVSAGDLAEARRLLNLGRAGAH